MDVFEETRGNLCDLSAGDLEGKFILHTDKSQQMKCAKLIAITNFKSQKYAEYKVQSTAKTKKIPVFHYWAPCLFTSVCFVRGPCREKFHNLDCTKIKYTS